jgi:hypothetical protein
MEAVQSPGYENRDGDGGDVEDGTDKNGGNRERGDEEDEEDESEANYLALYRYPPLPDPIFEFDEVQVFERFAGPGTWSIWEKDGTIIIPEAFSFLAQLTPEIDIEFDLYRHHHRSLPGRSFLGWLRNMYYSIIQQTVRQDPIWYALSAAARCGDNSVAGG